ncbi:hypothetical protein N7457_006297 [Penicillium paradoxum]|uniref:uncharacterized protein n=1 Tax=Penicillium paradoxum TaxID=176176 RepID=UPI0025478CDF|nr:uncharacterized protein N7457_006297 [Penicillium paradoxum]KAJ5781137.1 hypothetical protein N7457_006297 [Penicillium paradoxum]
MGKATTLDIEYASLMARNPEGTFLYIPPTFKKFHPGSVGFFDENGGWNQVTDLCKEGQSTADGFTALGRTLNRDEPKTSIWKTRSSESEDGQHVRLSGGVSAAAAAAVPVDVKGEGKHKTSASGKAGLVTGSIVKREKILAPFGKPVTAWASSNAKTLLASDFSTDIEKNGLWIIQSVWVTDECAIHMTNSKDKDVDVGLDIAATGVGKAGGGGGTFEKLKNEGWTTYQAQGDDGGLVVSFSGSHYKPRTFHRFRRDPLKQSKANSFLRERGEVVEELGFDVETVGVSSSDIEEEEEAERKEQEKVPAELEAKKTEILRNTIVTTEVVPH